MLKRLTVTAVILGALATSPGIGAEILEQVLVKVNGEIITKTEFEARQVAELRNRPELANSSPASAELQKAVAEITPDLILTAVDELLLIQRGRESGFALGDQQFAQILENIKTSNNLQDETKFQEALKQEGLTMADLRRNLERQMLVSAGSARRDSREDQHHGRRIEGVLRRASTGIHFAGRGDAAGDSPRSEEHRSRCERGGRRRRPRAGAGDPEATAGGRAVPASRGRAFDSGIQGERRSHRTVEKR